MRDERLLFKTERALREAGIKPSKRLGQNYAVDRDLIGCIVGAAAIGPGESVLEIGAGIGTLTGELARSARRVIAVEKDRRAAGYLRRVFSAAGNVEVVEGDILEMEMPAVDKVVSNLPFSISTPVTFKILGWEGFREAVLTYQIEVAERLTAAPGSREYSRLTVAASLLAEASIAGRFPPSAFYPEPEVGSAVVILRKRGSPNAAGVGWAALDKGLKALFSQRKRTLRKALSTICRGGAADWEGELGGLLAKRVFELSPAELARVCSSIDAWRQRSGREG